MFVSSLQVARAQFIDLATTADGGQLYFSTVFRQKGTQQSGNPKIVRWERGRGFELFAERERVFPSGGGNTSNYYRLTRPQVSADGRVVTYEAMRECQGGSSCLFVPRVQTEYVGGVVRTVQGQVWLSPDRRHAVERRNDVLVYPELYWRELVSGRERRIGAFNAGPVSFNAQGQALIGESGKWQLVDGTGVVREYPELEGTNGCRIALNGVGPFCGEGLIALTDTGWRLFLTPSGELSLHSGWSPKRIAVGVRSATISGYGNVVYYSTNDNRLVRFDTANDTTEELAGPTPVLGTWQGGVASGALNFAADTDAGTIRLNGQPVEAAGDGRFLVPPDVTPGPAVLTAFGATSLFEAPPQVREAKASDPEFLQFGVQLPGNYGPVIINQDFTAVVDHAPPGSIVHFYLTGLGGAKPNCMIRILDGAPRPADTLYIGPAPGLPGIDQFTIRIPQDARQFFVVSCGTDPRAQVFVPTR